jgi:hypothetical protein
VVIPFLLAAAAAADVAAPVAGRSVAEHDGRLSARAISCRPLPQVRAASGLARLGSQLLVVQDDREAFVLLDPETATVAGDQLVGRPIAKADKADWEAAVALSDGSVLALGSGAERARRRLDRVDEGGRQGLPKASEVYQAIEASLGQTPNIEGAALLGTDVLLFHRGFGAKPSATLRLALTGLLGETRPRIRERVLWDLGQMSGVPLGFTDAAAMDDGGVLFLAAAEDSPNAIDDGAVKGAAVGVIREGRGRWTELRFTTGVSAKSLKVEGLVLAPGTGGARGRSGFVVTDPDDPEIASDLCRIELDGPW